MFAASARLRRRSLLKLIKNRNRLPRGTIRTGREASTGATCRSCPNSARSPLVRALVPMRACQCARPSDYEVAHLLPHHCITRARSFPRARRLLSSLTRTLTPSRVAESRSALRRQPWHRTASPGPPASVSKSSAQGHARLRPVAAQAGPMQRRNQ